MLNRDYIKAKDRLKDAYIFKRLINRIGRFVFIVGFCFITYELIIRGILWL